MNLQQSPGAWSATLFSSSTLFSAPPKLQPFPCKEAPDSPLHPWEVPCCPLSVDDFWYFPSVPRQVWILLLFSGSFYARSWLATIPT